MKITSEANKYSEFYLLKMVSCLLLGIMIALLIGVTTPVFADSVNNWENIDASDMSYSDIVYGNNTFVAVGHDGISSSSDGITWSNHALGSRYFSGVAYGNGIFVVVGDGDCFTSTNGIDWTQRPTLSAISCITYGNGKFIAARVGPLYSTTVYTSTDGINWNSSEFGDYSKYWGFGNITFGNGVFVAAGSSKSPGSLGVAEILTSTDGYSWNGTALPSGYVVYGVCYGNGKFIVVGANNTTRSDLILSSNDGINWVDGSKGIPSWLRDVSYGDGTYVAVGVDILPVYYEGSTILTSNDGITWTKQVTNSKNPLRAVAYGNNMFVAVGDSGLIMKSKTVGGESQPSLKVIVEAEDKDSRNYVPVNDAIVSLYIGSTWISDTKSINGEATVSLVGLTDKQIASATVSAKKQWHYTRPSTDNRYQMIKKFGVDNQGNAIQFIYELHSEYIDSNGNWRGVPIKECYNESKPLTLTLGQPRMLANISVSYFCPSSLTYEEKTNYEQAIKATMTETSKYVAQATDGHIIFNKVIIVPTSTRSDFYFNNVNEAPLASMADIRIEASTLDDGNVTVHSNAHPLGYFHDFEMSDDILEDFHGLSTTEKEALAGLKTFRRVQLSARNYLKFDSVYNTSSAYPKTIVHELGHYMMGLLDEYENIEEKHFGIIDQFLFGKPYLTMGLMDNQEKSVELSKKSDYTYLTNVPESADTSSDFGKKATAQYFYYKTDCQSTLIKYMDKLGDLVNSEYLGNYTSSQDDRTAPYSYSSPSNISIVDSELYSVAHSNLEFNSIINEDLYYSEDTIGRLGFYGENNTTSITLIAPSVDKFQEFELYRIDQNGDMIPLVVGIGNYNFEQNIGESIEIILVARSIENGYLYYNTFFSDKFSAGMNGFYYQSDDELTAGYIMPESESVFFMTAINSSYVNGEFKTINQSISVASDNSNDFTGGLIQNVIIDSTFDLLSLQWFKSIDNGTTWTAAQMNINQSEKGIISTNCEIDGYGIYSLMAKHAGNDPIAIRDVQITQNIDYEDTIDIKIEASTDVKYYKIYYSDTPLNITDLNGEANIIFDTSQNSGVYTLNVSKDIRTTTERVVFVSCMAITNNGSRSEIYQSAPFTISPYDSNDDGIYDWYADLYYLWDNVDRQKDIGIEDTDNDGISNVNEYLNGTDPSAREDKMTIMIHPYLTTPTNSDVVVYATTNFGTLNKESHIFTENGSFEFIATDEVGNVTIQTVTITNIDKDTPLLMLNGNAIVQVEVHGSYSDEGALLSDNFDECRTVMGSGSINYDILGDYNLTYIAVDEAGNEAIPVVRTIRVVDTIAPIISLNGLPTISVKLGSIYTDQGAVANDNYDGVITSGIVTDNQVNTAKIGTYAVIYNVSDASGNDAVQVRRIVNVIYDFSGFRQPIDSGTNVINTVKAGRAIPVKFSLNGNQGLNIFSTGSPTSITANFSSSGLVFDTIEESSTITAGGSVLTYNAIDDQYTYVWNTEKLWIGYRIFIIKFADGTTYTANFKFSK